MRCCSWSRPAGFARVRQRTDATDFARGLYNFLELRGYSVFLDFEFRDELNDLGEIVGKRCDNLVFILTDNIFDSPWRVLAISAFAFFSFPRCFFRSGTPLFPLPRQPVRRQPPVCYETSGMRKNKRNWVGWGAGAWWSSQPLSRTTSMWCWSPRRARAGPCRVQTKRLIAPAQPRALCSPALGQGLLLIL